MSYSDLNRLIGAAQGGQMAVDERNRRLLSGDATWQALQNAVARLASFVPQDHDVLLQVFGLSVHKAEFLEPHAFLFEGIDHNGHQAGVVCHFTQVVASVVYLPKKGPSRVITGFAKAGA